MTTSWIKYITVDMSINLITIPFRGVHLIHANATGPMANIRGNLNELSSSSACIELVIARTIQETLSATRSGTRALRSFAHERILKPLLKAAEQAIQQAATIALGFYEVLATLAKGSITAFIVQSSLLSLFTIACIFFLLLHMYFHLGNKLFGILLR